MTNGASSSIELPILRESGTKVGRSALKFTFRFCTGEAEVDLCLGPSCDSDALTNWNDRSCPYSYSVRVVFAIHG